MKTTITRCLHGAVVGCTLGCLALVALTGCRTAAPAQQPAQPTYRGLMSPRGVVPPAWRQYPSATPTSATAAPQPSVEPLPPADEPLFVADEFEMPDFVDAAPTPVQLDEQPSPTPPSPEVGPAAATAGNRRELPHLANGRTVPNLPGAPANRRGTQQPAKPEPAATTATTVAGNNFYVVKNGDSLSKIAAAHKVKATDIMALNNLSSPDKIMVGQRLKMPATATGAGLEPPPTHAAIPADGLYTVANGDSLWTIGKRFGVKRDDIKAWNNLTSDKIRPGQQLRLKADAAQPKPQSPAKKPAETKPAPQQKPAEVKPAEPPKPVEQPPAPPQPQVEQPPVVVEETPEPPVDPVFEPVPNNDAVMLDVEVVSGETLESIANQYNVTVESLLQYNPQIKSNADLVDGLKIKVYISSAPQPPATK